MKYRKPSKNATNHPKFSDKSLLQLLPRMIFTLGISLYIFRIKQHVFELPFAIHLALIIKMRGLGIAAIAACQYALGLYARAEGDCRDEAVAAVAVDAFSGLCCGHPEGG